MTSPNECNKIAEHTMLFTVIYLQSILECKKRNTIDFNSKTALKKIEFFNNFVGRMKETPKNGVKTDDNKQIEKRK